LSVLDHTNAICENTLRSVKRLFARLAVLSKPRKSAFLA
jgi:hypothetical protein